MATQTPSRDSASKAPLCFYSIPIIDLYSNLSKPAYQR